VRHTYMLGLLRIKFKTVSELCNNNNNNNNNNNKRLRWSGLWYPSSWVKIRPKPSDLSGKKILSTPSFGGVVKPSVPCRKFTACKRTQKWRGSRQFRQHFSPIVPPSAAGVHSRRFRRGGHLVAGIGTF